jgi:ferredoxin
MILDDLCQTSAEKEKTLAEFIFSHPDAAVAACHPRAVRCLLLYAKIPESALDSLSYFSFRDMTIIQLASALNIKIPEKIKTEIDRADKPGPGHQKMNSGAKNSHKDTIKKFLTERDKALKEPASANRRAWFPVIDYSKCTHCGACLDFCLFGVYSKTDDDKITVTAPFNCKDNCPACARICPHNAIIFPKYNNPPFNGDLSETASEKRNLGKPLFALSGDELYQALKNRRKNT